MAKKQLDLSDFNVESENILDSTKEKQTRAKYKLKKKENLVAKIQVNLTKEEYNQLYSAFEQSGFPSFAGYLRMKLKEIKFI